MIRSGLERPAQPSGYALRRSRARSASLKLCTVNTALVAARAAHGVASFKERQHEIA